MRYIFAQHDRTFHIKTIREGIAEFRDIGKADPGNFLMHPLYDEILRQLADHFLGHWKDSIALLGLGGYGRKEMSPFSDIDLLFLRPDDASEGVYRGIRSLLYLLWDARVELGHSVRTIDECKHEADKDLAVLTSLLDMRFVWGDEKIFRQLLIERGELIRETDPLELYLKIEAEILKSSNKFGHTIYVLEPHLKEGPGSLRYMQLINWLSKLIFGCNSIDDLGMAGICGQKTVLEARAGLTFLAEIRTRLHFIADRRDDRLKFDSQSVIARDTGLVDTPERQAVESFMREYYRHASNMDFFGRRVLARARLFLRPKIAMEEKRLKLDDSFHLGAGGINHDFPENFGTDPKDLIRVFQKVAATGCELDIRLVDLIRRRLDAVNEELRQDPEANRMFLDIFRSRGAIAKALNAMMKIGFLERFITEFAWIRFLPQHDIYHQYTVDLHTMSVLEYIDSFARKTGDPDDHLLRVISSRLDHPEVLSLAGLFHDIAKGRGPGHEIRGEQIAAPVLRRLGLPEPHIEEVCFLIRNHLAMTHLAFKKDLHDSSLIGRFAENVMEQRRLDLLLLLTHADLRAVGPTAFGSWRRMLLEELYYRTLDVIEGEGLEGEDLAEWIRQIKGAIREIVPVDLRDENLDKFLQESGSRYFLDFYPGIIAGHYVAMRKYLDAEGKTELDLGDAIAEKTDHRRPGYSAITLLTRDRRGLFFRIAGTMSANRINILSAWTHSIGSLAVATFHVNDIPEGPLNDPARWEGFKSDFRKVLKGEVDVDELVLTRRRSRRPFGASSVPRFPLKVQVDNAASDRSTIIEVYAHDRPGLLYDITRKLTSLGLNISLTKITTEIDQAADIFYVQDELGNKIMDFDRMEEIRSSLKNHLTSMEEEHLSDKKEAIR